MSSSGASGAASSITYLTRTQLRRKFAADLFAILGSNITLLHLFNGADTTTTDDLSKNAATITHEATIASQLVEQGAGYTRTMNGSSNYSSIPDAAIYTFGNGSVDSPFSGVFVGNITDTGNLRQLIAKEDALSSQGEWDFHIDTLDKMIFRTRDETAGASTTRTSDSTISMGSMSMKGFVYNSTGGATNHNGTTLYQNGISIASTAANNGVYVAMNNKTENVQLGSFRNHSTGFFQGSYGMALIHPAVITADQMWSIYQLSRAFFGY